MAEDKADDDALAPDQLDDVSGGAVEAFMKGGGTTDAFIKIDPMADEAAREK